MSKIIEIRKVSTLAELRFELNELEIKAANYGIMDMSEVLIDPITFELRDMKTKSADPLRLRIYIELD